jgi:hypothetical protein
MARNLLHTCRLFITDRFLDERIGDDALIEMAALVNLG